MNIREDPYAILGVHRHASLDEVKRAYRRLVMQWHPDRNHSSAAGKEFLRIQAAYELLLDPQRLAEWRLTQAAAAREGRPTAAAPVAEDLTQSLTLTLEEAAAGCLKHIELLHHIRCAGCRGSGRLQHKHSLPCPRCNGCGRVARKGGGTSVCEGCAGRGYLRETDCSDCMGSGWRQEWRTLAVRVPPGLRDGERLRLARQAPLTPGNTIAGDLYLEISLATHPLFILDGHDLHCQLPVSIFRLLGGGHVEVPTLRGTTRFELLPQRSLEQRLPGLGFPHRQGAAVGDLVLHLQCIFPQAVGPEDLALLERLEMHLAADIEQRAPQLAAWERQLRARRQSGDA
ncbi:MAG: J domain-containing protein [Accumulibacter sp.]|jgi:molecular chaperone DnaJ|uniref:J domain-containing protein n=1 Tax=Accumulibacter sp. TaxID=2053492 RepID=UPI002FC35D27